MRSRRGLRGVMGEGRVVGLVTPRSLIARRRKSCATRKPRR
jgi:hypothetical protein